MSSTLKKTISSFVIIAMLFSCQDKPSKKELFEQQVQAQIAAIDGDIAVSFYNLSEVSDSLSINNNEKFHAASTMKVPVMIELFKQENAGLLDLNDSIVMKNEFKSIVDGSSYSMDFGEDSDSIIYKKIGAKATLKDLMYSMITVSSNLATNLLIEVVDAKEVTNSMRDLGAANIEVLRGVEDLKAFDLGLSNSTSARDLMLIMKAIAEGSAGTKKACERMIEILKDQKMNTMIPKYLPKDIEVAHKTGGITGVHHDAAIVYLPDGRSYVLVLLSKNLKQYEKGTDQLANISKTVFEYMVND